MAMWKEIWENLTTLKFPTQKKHVEELSSHILAFRQTYQLIN